MDEHTLKLFAQQLRKPEGEMGLEIAGRMNEGNRTMNLRTIEMLRVSPGDNILEIGMANGFFVKNILSVSQSVKYTGCDYSELMVEEAKILNQQFTDNGQALFYSASAEMLPFENESFNKVFTVNTIYFWDNPGKILSECNRVLKPGGILIISLRPEKSLKLLPVSKYGFKSYSNDELINLLALNNFNVKSLDEEEDGTIELEGEEINLSSVIVSSEKK